MGIIKKILIPFTQQHLKDRKLMLSLLKQEDDLFLSDLGQNHMTLHGGLYSLENNKALQRKVLLDNGFQTDDTSLKNYRSVIHHYYHSATDYDKEIMNSVVYLRENRLLYYTTPKPQAGDHLIDLDVLDLTGNHKVTLSSLISQKPYTILAAFSTS